MSKKSLICVIFFLIYVISAFAQEESITITTYYPSPYGSYNELRAKKMGIGDTYYQGTVSIPTSGLIVEGGVGIGTNAPGNNKLVIDNSSAIYPSSSYAIRINAGRYGIFAQATGQYSVGVSGSADLFDSRSVGVGGSGYTGVFGSGSTGVKGTSTAGYGVYADGGTGYGVYGEGDTFGVYAKLTSTSGNYAIYADAGSATGQAGYFNGRLSASGQIWSNTSIDSNGTISAAGTISAGGIITSNADLAEYFSTEPGEPGDVMVIDKNTDKRLVRSSEPYDYRVAGIISANPGVVLGEKAEGKKLVALLGQVKCKATIENGSIVPGDLLVTSSKSGYVMRADMEKLKPGMIVGKALEPLKEGEGEILVLVDGR